MNPRNWMLLVTLLGLAVAGPVAQASAAKVTGPKRVTVGKTVTFRASGFDAGKRLWVSMHPVSTRGGNCCGATIRKRFRTNGKGRARVRFRVPRGYQACAGVGNCSKRRWKAGEKADVLFSTRSSAGSHLLKVVRVRKASASAAAAARTGSAGT